MTRLALTREVSSGLGRCELTHVSRQPIDIGRARAEHERYEQALIEAGCHVERLAASAEMPDSVFIEDIALVFDELAVMTRPGAESRRIETPSVAHALGRYRSLQAMEAPATLDGGDVLTLGRQVFVGRSARTNDQGVAALGRLLAPFGYVVAAVPIAGCLHLKSAVTQVGDELLLINPKWVSPTTFEGWAFVEVDPDEPYAANALRIGKRVMYPASFPRTRARLEERQIDVHPVDARELAKAEGAVTCCSLVFRP
jgi:dimethylargininase